MKGTDTLKKLNFLVNSCGIKENNLILNNFLINYAKLLSENDVTNLCDFLSKENDIDIYNWLIGIKYLPLRLKSNILQILIKYSTSL